MNLLQSFDNDKLSVIALYKFVLGIALDLGISFEGSFRLICDSAQVNRSQLYERVNQLKGYLAKIEISGPGRPTTCQPASEASVQEAKGWQFLEAVLRYRLAHAGALVQHIGGHATYSDGFVRFILDLRDTWDGSLEWFCLQVEVPYQTLRSWDKKDRAQPYEKHQPRESGAFTGKASNDVLQIVQDYKVWEGSAKDFAKFEAERLRLKQSPIYRVLKVFCLLPVRSRKEPRYRGSTEKCLPGSILVTDGKTVEVVCTGSGEVLNYNWQGIVDQATVCHTAVVVTNTECAQGVREAFDASCEFLGHPPQALLHDNKPIHNEQELREHIEKTTIMIPATPDRGENKAAIEGEFGKFEQAVGTIYLDDSNVDRLKMSSVHEILRAYTAGLNHAGREELDGKSRESILKKSCPDSKKDRQFIENLHGDHTKKQRCDHLPTKQASLAILNAAFELFAIAALDADGKIREWLASRFTPESIRQGVAIFGTEQEKGRLQSKTAHRYLVKVIVNRQHENDLRRQEELLREFAEVERPAWLRDFEAEYAGLVVECESAATPGQELAFRLAENAVFGCLNLQRAFWQEKLKAQLEKQRDRYAAVSKHIQRLFETTWENRFALISKLVAWESGLTA